MIHPVPRPKVSVLIPAYNGAPFLAEAIESVLAQTLRDFELIVADDRSSDGSQDVAKRYCERDPRVRYYENERNVGCVRNINRLILESRGDYIKILIQDDVLSPDYLECCAAVLDAHRDVSLVTSFQRFMGQQSDVRKLPTLPAIGKLDGRQVQRHLLANSNWIGGETAVMIRRSSLDVGLFNPDWVWQVDQDLWLRILGRGNLYVVPQILSYPRIHGQQGTVTLNKGYTFIREELLQLKTAFLAPETYGDFAPEDQERLYERHLSRLIRKGLDAPEAGARRSMLKIGHEAAGLQFWRLFAAVWSERYLQPWVGGRLFRQLVSVARGYLSGLADRRWMKDMAFKPERATVDLGFTTADTFGEIAAPVELLRSPIMTPVGVKVVRLDETPHYLWIKRLIDRTNDEEARDAYRTYLELYHPDDDVEGTILKISDLAERIREESAKGQLVSIVTHPPAQYRGEFCAVIYDGNHRASIAKALGHTHVISRLVNIRMTSDYFPPNYFEDETGWPGAIPLNS
jgi:hypothetical protein